MAKTDSHIVIVLVHGAFTDASSWTGVIEQLQIHGYTVMAPPNPLRGLTDDSAYIASYLKQIDSQVLLVGHSYGGAVITNAANKTNNVFGLVYVAAYAPDENEKLMDVQNSSKDSVINKALIESQYPTNQGPKIAIEYSINPDLFRETFAADLPIKQTDVMAATQRPLAASAFTDPSGPPAWKNLPSYAIVATEDKAAGSDVIRLMARRAKAEIVELESSHVIMISKPKEVTNVIVKAVSTFSSSEMSLGIGL